MHVGAYAWVRACVHIIQQYVSVHMYTDMSIFT